MSTSTAAAAAAAAAATQAKRPKASPSAAESLLAASQVGYRSFLSSSMRALAYGAEASDSPTNYARYSVRDYEEAKEVQDRLAASGVGTFWQEDLEEARRSEAEIRSANSEFIARFRDRLQVTGDVTAGTKIPGGYEWVEASSELAGAAQRGERRLWVDPEKVGAESVLLEGTGEERVRAVARCEWVDPLALFILKRSEPQLDPIVGGRQSGIGGLPGPDADPFAIAAGLVDSPMTQRPEYAPGSIERLKDQVARLGHQRADEYLRRMYLPPSDYRREEWVSAETENLFRAWMSSERNNRDADGWKRRITQRLACTYTDTVHALPGKLETLVFRQRNQTFLNVILEATTQAPPRGATAPIFRIAGHYYTFSLQLLAKFSDPENVV